MKTRIAATCIVVAPLLLGGCTVFHKLGFGHARSVEQAARARNAGSPIVTDGFTAAGRAHLDAGNPGLAIEAFQQAIGIGEPRAPALNGLGVAYARIGRTDLAAQLFQQAIAEDPASERYAANLALLEQSQQPPEAPESVRTAEQTASESPALPPALAPAPAPAPAPAAARVPAPAVAAKVAAAQPRQIEGQLVQIAPREFSIRTMRPQAAGTPTVAGAARQVTVPAGFRPIVRITLRPPGPITAAPDAPRGKRPSR